MGDYYRLYLESDDAFEKLIVSLCDDLLGVGVVSFTKGRDGGRDGRFEGTARKYPSEESLWKGKFIIQAKHTGNAIASCSDSEFDSSIIKKEIPRIKALVSAKECDNYLMFTNRKLTGGKEKEVREKIKGDTSVSSFAIHGIEDIERYLRKLPDVVKAHDLHKNRTPLRIFPDQLAKVISEFSDRSEKIQTAFDSAHSFSYPGITSKNERNGLSDDYFEYIRSDSEPYFEQIRSFLGDSKNSELAKKYHNTADELKSKLITHRDRFGTFDEVLTDVCDLLVDGDGFLRENRKLLNVFLHFMYCNCDIGKSGAETN